MVTLLYATKKIKPYEECVVEVYKTAKSAAEALKEYSRMYGFWYDFRLETRRLQE